MKIWGKIQGGKIVNATEPNITTHLSQTSLHPHGKVAK
jgi:hypothetical protein